MSEGICKACKRFENLLHVRDRIVFESREVLWRSNGQARAHDIHVHMLRVKHPRFVNIELLTDH